VTLGDLAEELHPLADPQVLAGLERDELPVLVDYVQQVARLHARLSRRRSSAVAKLNTASVVATSHRAKPIRSRLL